jgi:hypothetical protein
VHFFSFRFTLTVLNTVDSFTEIKGLPRARKFKWFTNDSRFKWRVPQALYRKMTSRAHRPSHAGRAGNSFQQARMANNGILRATDDILDPI